VKFAEVTVSVQSHLIVIFVATELVLIVVLLAIVTVI
jgi:hypothetical protein